MKRPVLLEPVEIAKFWKSARDRTKHVRIELSEYEGNALVSIRVWQGGTDGCDRPTKTGINLGIRKLRELRKALEKADAKAIEIGWLDDEGAE